VHHQFPAKAIYVQWLICSNGLVSFFFFSFFSSLFSIYMSVSLCRVSNLPFGWLLKQRQRSYSLMGDDPVVFLCTVIPTILMLYGLFRFAQVCVLTLCEWVCVRVCMCVCVCAYICLFCVSFLLLICTGVYSMA